VRFLETYRERNAYAVHRFPADREHVPTNLQSWIFVDGLAQLLNYRRVARGGYFELRRLADRHTDDVDSYGLADCHTDDVDSYGLADRHTDDVDSYGLADRHTDDVDSYGLADRHTDDVDSHACADLRRDAGAVQRRAG
jgi:hypothetical protein